MARYFLHVRTDRRSKDNRAAASAAHNAGGRMADDRSGEGDDHPPHEGVADKHIVLPASLAKRLTLRLLHPLRAPYDPRPRTPERPMDRHAVGTAENHVAAGEGGSEWWNVGAGRCLHIR